MHALTGWFIRNPVAANLLMVMILVAGAFSLNSIRIEVFPKCRRTPSSSRQHIPVHTRRR